MVIEVNKVPLSIDHKYCLIEAANWAWLNTHREELQTCFQVTSFDSSLVCLYMFSYKLWGLYLTLWAMLCTFMALSPFHFKAVTLKNIKKLHERCKTAFCGSFIFKVNKRHGM